MSNNVKRYCVVCGREYNNIHQHYKTKKHQNAMMSAQKSNDDDNTDTDIENNENIITPEKIDVVEVEENEELEEKEKTTGTIQIIDSSTNKPQKSTVQQIMDVAFSEQFAPITMSILDAIVKRVTNQHNPEQEEGKYVLSVSGAKIPVLNENF